LAGRRKVKCRLSPSDQTQGLGVSRHHIFPNHLKFLFLALLLELIRISETHRHFFNDGTTFETAKLLVTFSQLEMKVIFFFLLQFNSFDQR
jgi:hypothetical protein